MLPKLKGREDIVFGADQVWKKWLDFGDGLIFEVTPALWMSNFDPK